MVARDPFKLYATTATTFTTYPLLSFEIPSTTIIVIYRMDCCTTHHLS